MPHARIQFEPDPNNPVGKGPQRYIRGRIKFRIEDPTLGVQGCDITGVIVGRDEDGVDLQVKAAPSRILMPDTQAWLCRLVEETPELVELLPPKQPAVNLVIEEKGPEVEF